MNGRAALNTFVVQYFYVPINTLISGRFNFYTIRRRSLVNSYRSHHSKTKPRKETVSTAHAKHRNVMFGLILCVLSHAI